MNHEILKQFLKHIYSSYFRINKRFSGIVSAHLQRNFRDVSKNKQRLFSKGMDNNLNLSLWVTKKKRQGQILGSALTNLVSSGCALSPYAGPQ